MIRLSIAKLAEYCGVSKNGLMRCTKPAGLSSSRGNHYELLPWQALSLCGTTLLLNHGLRPPDIMPAIHVLRRLGFPYSWPELYKDESIDVLSVYNREFIGVHPDKGVYFSIPSARLLTVPPPKLVCHSVHVGTLRAAIHRALAEFTPGAAGS